MPIYMNTLISRNHGIIHSDMDGETVMMSIDLGSYFGLNTMATFIWECIDTPSTVADIITSIREHFDVEQAKCEKDTLEFLNDMVERKIIEIE